VPLAGHSVERYLSFTEWRTAPVVPEVGRPRHCLAHLWTPGRWRGMALRVPPQPMGLEAARAAERPVMSDNIIARICLNVDEAAVALGCSTKNIRRVLADKRLPHSRLKTSRGKGRVVIKVADLEKLLEPEARQ